jgi:hypothetical protein
MVSKKKDKNEVKDIKSNNLKRSETGWKVHEFSFRNESSSMNTTLVAKTSDPDLVHVTRLFEVIQKQMYSVHTNHYQQITITGSAGIKYT